MPSWKGIQHGIAGSFAVVVLVSLVGARSAHAGGWQEMHETSDDVRLEVGSDGVANIEHHLRYRIVAGRFKTFDLVGVDPRAEIAPEAVLTPEKGGGADIVARVEPVPKTPGTLRLSIDEGKGLGRGAYVVDVKYRLDLVATKMLTQEGAMWRLAWTAPPAPEGHDGARVIFDLPSAATEPRLAAAAESTTTLSTLRRGPDRDELELVRAHVPRGEAVTWTARVDPKAFPRVMSPELRPPPPPEVAAPSLIASNLSRVLISIGFAVLAGVLAALLREKQKAVKSAVAFVPALRSLFKQTARPLVPMPWGTGPFAFGIVLSGALAVLLWSSPIAGAALVSLAMALAAHRAPLVVARARGPGAWQPMSDPKTLLPQPPPALPTDAYDLATRRGLVTFLILFVVAGVTTWVLRLRVPQIAIALPLAFSALIPIFATGTRAQLMKAPIDLAARMLRPARDALASMIDLTHVELGTIGRVVGGHKKSTTAAPAVIDEARLACAPHDRTPGLRTIELALAICPGGQAAMPEVFVRFDDASAAAERIARLAPGTQVVCGRTPEERVIRLLPEEPTPEAAAALVAKLLLALEGRRASDRRAMATAAQAQPANEPPPSRIRFQGVERRGRRLLASSAGMAA